MVLKCFVCGNEDQTVMLSICDGCTHSWYVERGLPCPLKCCSACDEIAAKHAEADQEEFDPEAVEAERRADLTSDGDGN